MKNFISLFALSQMVVGKAQINLDNVYPANSGIQQMQVLELSNNGYKYQLISGYTDLLGNTRLRRNKIFF